MPIQWFGKKPESFTHRGYEVKWNAADNKFIIRHFPTRFESALCDTKLEAIRLIDGELDGK